MGISDRNYNTHLSYGNKINPLVILIAIAMMLFVVLVFFKALTFVRMPQNADATGYFNTNILCWFGLSGDAGKLLSRPWTLLTYSFSYTNIWQLFASLIWLWSFGYILIDLTGFKKIAPIFLYGTLAGAIIFLVVGNLLPASVAAPQYLLGGSAGILAVAAAATTINPKYKIFPMLGGGISLWIFATIYLIIDLATLPPNAPILYIAHIAGALTGFLFIFILRKGIDGSDWMNNLYDWIVNLFNPEKPDQSRSKIKSTLFYNAAGQPFTKQPKLTQQRLDEILDKINQLGYDALSADEKSFLERVSKEDFKGK